ncbi:RNA-binding S4 domain-containing protein [Aestuariivirga sp.]|uniref:RNA-binding S4 domain-containing protein n=1 Tax=Aestuariivirga sp. TaxID=2650926 RepID=UPI0039E232B7
MGEDTRQRLDKWLWFARIVRTRAMAQELVEAGHVRINRQRTQKPGHDVKVGDVLTITLHGGVKVLKVDGLAPRRGGAPSAQLLYTDLAMPGGDAASAEKGDAPGSGLC